MKAIRILTLCLITLLLIMSTVHAQVSFIVSSPKAGDSWKLGETKNIQWSYSSSQAVSQNWKLELMKGSRVLGTIVNNISGNSYSWVVGQYLGGNALLGADYKIRVSHVSAPGISNNSGVFSIILSSITQKITASEKPVVKKNLPAMERKIETPVIQSFPDLVIKEVSCERRDTYPEGTIINLPNPPILEIHFRIANQGDGDAVEPIFDHLICHQGYMDCNYIQYTYAFPPKKPSLKAKSEISLGYYRCKLPETTCRDFSVIVDPDNTIREKNELNNEFRFTCPE